MEEGNYTKDGVFYYHYVVAYKSGRALGCAYAIPNGCDKSSSSEDCGNEDMATSDAPETSKDSEKPSDMPASTASESSSKNMPTSVSGESHNVVLKTIDLGDLKDSFTSNDSNTSQKSNVTNQAVAADSDNEDLGIFALLAALLVSLLVII
jgi:hypothetical protein